MILSDHEIMDFIKQKKIIIEPFDEDSVGPCSVDLHLDCVFSMFRMGIVVDSRDRERAFEKNIETLDTGGEPFTIAPNQFVLAKTVESIAIPKYIVATLEGLSSVARMGIMVHAAGLVNPGTGLKKPSTLTLEISCHNSSPVVLYPGQKIVQMIFHQLNSPAKQGYDERPGSRYVGQGAQILI
ncbi:MAG: dCTP deaminase [Candidatus Helarchaeales archaeon]